MDRRVDDDPLRPVVDERAVPARTHELGRLRGTERARIGGGVRAEGSAWSAPATANQ